MSDNPFLKRILLACSRGPARIFRVNTGQGWVGKSWRAPSRTTVELEAGDVVIRQARPLHAGLVEGGADLIGWRSRVIQPEDVGTRVAVFTALEAKQGSGRVTEAQARFLQAVEAAGGIARVVRSVEDAQDALG